MTEPEFNHDNFTLISKVADRYQSMVGKRLDRISLLMDLSAADGVNGNPLIDWEGMLTSDAHGLAHDVSGILRHLDRDTGKVGGHFVPRFVKTTAA